jgi:hypothetical protein
MEFDERLHRAFDALAERLQQDIAEQLSAARIGLAGSVRADWDGAVADATREARIVAEREVGERLATEIVRREHGARAESLASRIAAADRLTEAVRALDAVQSLSEILDVLVTTSSVEAGRAAIFLPQGSTLKGWRLAGFEAVASGSSVELPFADGGMIAEAGETGRSIRLEAGAPRGTLVPSFVELRDQSRAVAFPLVMTGQVFAVLYADDEGREPDGQPWPASIEVLSRHAARALEAITATRLAQVADAVSREPSSVQSLQADRDAGTVHTG